VVASDADSAQKALGRALGRRVTGRLGERVMMAACEPAPIGHLEDPVYLGRIGRARGDGTIDMPPGKRSSASPTRLRRG
jgi:ATP-binding cassette subfamily B protein